MPAKFYQLKFERPLDEGDKFASVNRRKCPECGLRVIKFHSEFEVEEDGVRRAHLRSLDPLRGPFAGGLLMMVTPAFAQRMTAAGLTGFEIREGLVTVENDEGKILSRHNYAWIVVTGRCRTNDVWTRVASTCPRCGRQRAESFDRITRTVWLLNPGPTADLSRAREAMVGIVASDRFVELLFSEGPEVREYVSVSELAVREKDAD